PVAQWAHTTGGLGAANWQGSPGEGAGWAVKLSPPSCETSTLPPMPVPTPDCTITSAPCTHRTPETVPAADAAPHASLATGTWRSRPLPLPFGSTVASA